MLDNHIELGYVVEDPEHQQNATIFCIKTELAYIYIKADTLEELSDWMAQVSYFSKNKLSDWTEYCFQACNTVSQSKTTASKLITYFVFLIVWQINEVTISIIYQLLSFWFYLKFVHGK